MMGFCDFSLLGLAEAETVLNEVTILPFTSELHQHQLGGGGKKLCALV
jgi:hypothetical protein